MRLAPSTRIGPYEVVSMIGAGGMGEVYRARDTTLGRQVALKVLTATVAQDPERIARFRREAQMLAALNHPLIGAIYGLDESGSAPVLVLELIEGPTLADRIAAGPIPIDEALRIAHQIAQALEAAHERGIIHRDLKPSNVKLRSDGTVKVLDFGLARALDRTSDVLPSDALATVTSPDVTAIGMVLGTAAYMSPEQATGQSVDRGADIWAFGAVLFETLTGSRAFEGSDPAQTIASVLRSDPLWSRLPADTPLGIRRLLRRCLEKDRRRRQADIRDAALDIEDVQRQDGERTPAASASTYAAKRVLWLAGVVLVLAAALAALVMTGNDTPVTLSERHVEIVTPPTNDPVSLALSPDGRHLAFVAVQQGRTQLWVRDLATGSSEPVVGSDGASAPFWSPDSRFLAFFAAEKVRRAGLDGSPPRTLGPAIIGTGGTWSPSWALLYPMVPDSPLYQLPADGGLPRPLKMPPIGQPGGHRYPHFLPDGHHFLFFVAELRSVFVGSTQGSAPVRLLDADAAAVFSPPSEILFVRGGALYAQRFVPARLLLEGEPSRLAAGVAVDAFGGAAISASTEGTIAYRTGSGSQDRQFVWFDRGGKPLSVVGAPDGAAPMNPALSPDARRLAFSRSIDGNTDVWISDIDRGIPVPLTRTALPDIVPIWSPDGESIVFSSLGEGGFELRRMKIGDNSEPRSLLSAPFPGIAMDYSLDGRYVLYRPPARDYQWDVWAASMDGGQPIHVVNSKFDDRTAQLSPDSRFIAFESNQTGQYEIYVRPFPAPGADKPVSAGGGSQPRVRRRGNSRDEYEVFYVAPDRYLMAAIITVRAGGEMSIGTPQRLFAAPIRSTVYGGTSFEYDVTADGQRFLLNTFVEQSPAPISLILNRKALRQ